MPSVLGEIIEWGETLPFWEKIALDMIISGEEFAYEKFDELLQYLLEDNNLTDTPKFGRKQLQFSQASSIPDDVIRGKPKLKKIENLQNINALVSGQVLEFNPSLTMIYGENGSGKSGYARVIGSAAFTRGDRQILPDVNKPDTGERLSANIEIEIDGKHFSLHHEIGSACPEMRSFYVFDSTSVRVHLLHSNPMSFSPAGLIYLKRLTEITDQVRQRLNMLIEKKTKENIYISQFSGQTDISEKIASLRPDTDIDALISLSSISDDELSKISELDKEIGRLKSENISEKIEAFNQTITDLKELVSSIKYLTTILGDQQVEIVQTKIKEWGNLNQATQSQSLERFRKPFFSQIGTQTWTEFIKLAQSLAKAESEEYPHEDDYCLLCHQPIQNDSHRLLHDLWASLESDAHERLQQIEDELNLYDQQLSELDFEILDDQRVSYRHLAEQDQEALQIAKLYIQMAQTRCSILLKCIHEKSEISVISLPDEGIVEIGRVIGHIEIQKTNLENLKVEEEIKKLEDEKLYLEHRKMLQVNIRGISDYVLDAKWVQKASQPSVRRSTAHISRKYSELFTKLVTEEYLRLFAETLKNLSCPLQVRVQTKTHKGETFKQIGLTVDSSVDPSRATPDKVLSEGEQRAVALADFLTEVALDNESSGIILDDPVTSLDFQWKAKIAKHIVEEARRQQVIVFTHDLHFLYILSELASDASLDMSSHWIEKHEDIPGHVHLNNSPAVEGKYKKTNLVLEIYQQANNPSIGPEQRERLLKEGFGALRTCYEALVVFELFNGVILRFDEQIRINNLKDVVIDPKVTKKIIDKVGYLSRFIEGHLHSDSFVAQKPTPKMLMDEITEYDRIKKEIKDSKSIDH